MVVSIGPAQTQTEFGETTEESILYFIIPFKVRIKDLPLIVKQLCASIGLTFIISAIPLCRRLYERYIISLLLINIVIVFLFNFCC